MESKNIIIILVVIIVILAAAIGFMVLKPMHAKEPTKIKVTSNKTLYEGKDLTVKLTDLNKTPLSNQKVNVSIKNDKGKVVANKTVKTNDNGNAKLDLDLKRGKYDVTVSYDGNENYTGNNTTQKLTIKEKVKETISESNTGQSSKPPRTEYTGDPNDREAYIEWRRQDLQSENPHRGYNPRLDGPENAPAR
ncbi:MAG: hypothetical protein UIB63_09920 [Methanobrevibacter sp.]|uniref:Ig-like domain repeat protein n=1 Tax=Methanobrevibacter sp. TaxID=66852 RepID=UPI002E79A344|nr:hypothetical protein [Methanobrevibacter sp.]MEE0943411.1 hypothetical protein [Methanobrevibacter sp.]